MAWCIWASGGSALSCRPCVLARCSSSSGILFHASAVTACFAHLQSVLGQAAGLAGLLYPPKLWCMVICAERGLLQQTLLVFDAVQNRALPLADVLRHLGQPGGLLTVHQHLRHCQRDLQAADTQHQECKHKVCSYSTVVDSKTI